MANIFTDKPYQSNTSATPVTENVFNTSNPYGVKTGGGQSIATTPTVTNTPVINSSTLTGGNGAIVLPTETPTDYTTPLAGLNQTVVTNNNQQTQQNDPITKAREDYLASLSQGDSAATIYQDVYGKPISPEEYAAQKKNVADLSAQLGNITAGAQISNQQLESAASGKDITSTFLGRQQQEVNRQAVIKGMPVAAALQAAQGNLTAAKESLDKLYEAKKTDAENKNTYNNKLAELTYQFASEDQKAKMDAAIRKENRDFEMQKQNQSIANDMAKSILAYDPKLATEMASIDWTQPNAQTKFSALQSKIQADPRVQADLALSRAQLAETQKRTALLGEPTPAEKKAEAEALKTSKGLIPVLQDKITLADQILNSPGMSIRVGPNQASRQAVGWENLNILNTPNQIGMGLVDATGVGQQFAGGVHRLASTEFINTLINAKAEGATFGNLTEREGDALRAAATQLNDWEIKDSKGNGMGIWNIDETSFKQELNRLKTLAQKAIGDNAANLMTPAEQAELDAQFSNQDASVYY